MSLFKTRDWWSTTVGEEEEFDSGCLCLANIDNDTNGLDKIIIGSFQGLLRIYNPNPSTNEVEDVVLEQAFKLPILQVSAGRFSSASDSLKLGILHSRKLAVYNVTSIGGTVEHGSQYQLSLLYEHNLQRTAFNMCHGPFGGVKGKDFLCVQSMDGTISIFEQESFAFSRFLPGALLPGPIQYMPRLDSFVTASSSWRVEAYRYQVLAVASETGAKEELQNIKSGKKVAVDWTYNIGEQALHISYIELPNLPPSIVVLGERSIFCLTDNGTLRFVKKLEYDPSCIHPYASLSENSINYIVGAHSNSMLIYSDVMLKWMAKMEFVPVQVCVGDFKGLKKAVVGLSEKGRLEVMYLGTDPAVFTPPQVESRDVNMGTIDQEMSRLMRHVKNKSVNNVITPNLKTDDDLSIFVHANPNLDDQSMATGVEFQEDVVPSCTIRIQMKARLTLDTVKLEIHVPWPLATNQSEFLIPVLDPNTPSETFVAVFQRYPGLPAHMYIQVSASYTSSTGARRVATSRSNLPSKLVLKPVLPVKAAVHKLTVDTNRPPISLNELFPDLLGENASGAGAALGFQYFGGGPIVTVLASKTSQRYRLQSDRLEAMWLPLRELVARLNGHFRKGAHSDFRVSFDGSLPLQEYFELIDNHFDFRNGSGKCKELLAQRAAQFRTIQKRLLTRFKDKTPAPLQNLDTLLEGTYRQILALAEAVDENSTAERLASNNLSSGTYLLNLLLKLWMDMGDDEFKVLERTLTPVINSSEEQGWEESVDAAISHLLRTTMAKSAKDQAVNPTPLTTPSDTSKVKKHIALFCDRIGKGARLVDGMQDKKEKTIKMPAPKTIMETNENEANDDETSLGPMMKMSHATPSSGKKKKKKNKDNDKDRQITDNLFGLPQIDRPSAGLSALSSDIRPPPITMSNKFDSESSPSQQRIESMVPDLDSMNDNEDSDMFTMRKDDLGMELKDDEDEEVQLGAGEDGTFSTRGKGSARDDDGVSNGIGFGEPSPYYHQEGDGKKYAG